MLRETLVVFFFLGTALSANILGLMGVMSPSHHQWNSALMRELGRRGHNVTVLSPDLPKSKETNVHYIHLELLYKTMYENEDTSNNIDISDFFGVSGFEAIRDFYGYVLMSLPGIYKSEGFKKLLDYPDKFKFDLVIYDYSAGSFLLGFLEKFNYPPLIGVSPFLLPPNTADLIGNHHFTGYIPHWTTKYDVNMSFSERIENTALYYFDMIYRRYVLTPAIDKVFRPYFPNSTPYIGDLEKRTVLALVNSHPAVNYPESLPPNVIEVGGLQLSEPQPLETEIDTFMNNSKKGAIFFSLGTNVRAENLKEKRIQIILDTMAQLPEYNFLWKMDFDQTKFKISKNVLIKRFFPQRDILGHPKIKVFVTHSGGLSTQEAIWQGVPMIGMALFADQPRNLHRSVLNGIAAKVDFSTLSVDGLKQAILKVREDKSYIENIKTRSQLYRDQPMKPLDTAAWWVEYVIRNPKATHMRSPTLDMNFFIAHSLDVIAFVLVVLIILNIFLYKVIGFCLIVYANKRNNNYGLSKKKA